MNENPSAPAPADNEAGTTPLSIKARRTNSRQLYSGGVFALVAVLAYYGYSAKTANILHLYGGLLMFVGAAIPSLLWAKRADQRFPVFEVFMLTGINTYAIPLLGGHEGLARYDDDTLSAAAFCILLFQTVANIVYINTVGIPKRTVNWTREVVSRNITDYLGYGMAITTTYTILIGFTDWIPSDINSILRAACYGIGIISTFIQARMWGQGTLPHYRKGIFIAQLALQVIFSWAALFLIGGISILVLGLLGFVSGGKKIPILAILITLPAVGILHNGKSLMRDKYWEGRTPMPTLTELPAFYSEWISFGLQSPEDQTSRRETTKLLDRTSLFHILCLVVSETPDPRPYLEGETYSYVPSQFVPSFFWRGKPPAHVATNRLSVYYGLQATEDTAKTTIAFGLITEAYANFGLFGVSLLAAVFAFCFKKFSDWSSLSPILSYPGLVLIVLMAWSFQAELTLAAWLSSLYQACFVILGIPFLIRNLIGE
jgi:hypothetical protein